VYSDSVILRDTAIPPSGIFIKLSDTDQSSQKTLVLKGENDCFSFNFYTFTSSFCLLKWVF